MLIGHTFEDALSAPVFVVSSADDTALVGDVVSGDCSLGEACTTDCSSNPPYNICTYLCRQSTV